MYFDSAANHWDDERRQERALLLAEKIRKDWGIKPAKILDFGCGTGLLSFPLSAHAGCVYAYDPSGEMQGVFSSKLMQYQTANIHLVTSEEMSKQTYDVILSSMVFHHIRDISSQISSLRQLLVPGGRFILIDLNRDDGSFHLNEPGFDGHHGFEQEEVIHVLNHLGFRDISTSTVYRGNKQVERRNIEYSLFMAVAKR